MHSDSGDYTYRAPAPAGGGHVLPILKTGPERLQIYCDALDRRLEDAERRLAGLELLVHRLLNADEAQP